MSSRPLHCSPWAVMPSIRYFWHLGDTVDKELSNALSFQKWNIPSRLHPPPSIIRIFIIHITLPTGADVYHQSLKTLEKKISSLYHFIPVVEVRNT